MKEEHKQRIEELYIEMHDKLILYANCALKNASLAEEAVQEAFQIACQKADKLCSSPNPQGWIMLTLRNTIQNMRRSQLSTKKLMEKYLLKQSGSIVFSEDTVSLNILYDGLADSEEFKLLYEMTIEGLSHEEMAASRGISLSACKKRVQRAKLVLQRKIKR